MERLYKAEPWITILGGMVFSIILWICIRPPKLISKKTIPPAVCIMIIILVSIGSYYARKEYTYVPKIYLNEESLSDARKKLEKEGLICLDRNIIIDPIARMQLNNGKDLNDNSFKVISMDYDYDTFVKQGTEINVSITWSDNFHNPSLAWQDGTEFNPQEYYENIDLNSLYGNNSDKIVVNTALAGSKSNNSGHYSSEIGVYPGYGTHIIIEIELVNYLDPQINYREVAYLGEQVSFSDMPDGIYYYIVYASGYKIAFSSTLIKIEKQENISEFAVMWDANLERIGGTYSDPFYIKLEDSAGHTLSSVEVSLFVKSSIDGEPNKFDSYSLISNADGLLTCDNEVVDFQLFDKCYIQLVLESTWKESYIVQEPDDNNIAKCVIPNQ